MKVLDLIRYIAQNPSYSIIEFDDLEPLTPMQAILELASIDPSHYESKFFKIQGFQKTLFVYHI